MPDETETAEVPTILVGSVLEDANGYCLYVASVNEATFTVYDFPEQVIEPCLFVMREIRNVPNITEFFVVRSPTWPEVLRLQRAWGITTADGILGPQTILAARLAHPTTDADADAAEASETPQVPTRFDREID